LSVAILLTAIPTKQSLTLIGFWLFKTISALVPEQN
jgi:hypothetical protein